MIFWCHLKIREVDKEDDLCGLSQIDRNKYQTTGHQFMTLPDWSSKTKDKKGDCYKEKKISKNFNCQVVTWWGQSPSSCSCCQRSCCRCCHCCCCLVGWCGWRQLKQRSSLVKRSWSFNSGAGNLNFPSSPLASPQQLQMPPPLSTKQARIKIQLLIIGSLF